MHNKNIILSIGLLVILTAAGCGQVMAATPVGDQAPPEVPVVEEPQPAELVLEEPTSAATLADETSADENGELPALVEIKIENFAYSPQSITVPVGTEIKWTNMDSIQHNVVSDEGSELGSALLSKGESFSHVFTAPGTYAYHCGPHPRMTAVVIVTP